MATPTTIRSTNNKIIDRLTLLFQTLVSDVQGTEQAGRITMTNGNTAVTGIDSAFVADLTEGHYIAFKADRGGYDGFGLIDTIVNANSLTLAANYTGETGTKKNFVTFTKDEYLHATEYPSVLDLRVYDAMTEHEPNTPNCEWWFYSEEITDHAENALGMVGLTMAVHRPSFRLMQMETQELIFDLERWLNAHHTEQIFWDYIQYAGFSSPVVYTAKDQQSDMLVTTFYFNIAYLRQAY